MKIIKYEYSLLILLQEEIAPYINYKNSYYILFLEYIKLKISFT